jgi:hypothetical protein
MRLPSPTHWEPADRVDKLLRFRCLKATPSGFALPSCNFCKEFAIVSLCELGDRVMWIVMYVAMIASLSAMGMVPGAETGDPLPHDEA